MLTEHEWLASTGQPDYMDECIKGISVRKQRLVGCELARRCWHLLIDPASRAAVEVAERYADGLATAAELAAARTLAGEARQRAIDRSDPYAYPRHSPEAHAALLAELVAVPLEPGQLISPFPDALDAATDRPAELAATADLMRCVFGNPFRPVAFDPAWRTPFAVVIAESVYDIRYFDPLPFLADALEEAGCGDPAVLAHCRGGGPHARGCWVVDLVLGKT